MYRYKLLALVFLLSFFCCFFPSVFVVFFFVSVLFYLLRLWFLRQYPKRFLLTHTPCVYINEDESLKLLVRQRPLRLLHPSDFSPSSQSPQASAVSPVINQSIAQNWPKTKRIPFECIFMGLQSSAAN